MNKKPHPESVIPEIVKRVIETGKERNALFSEYIRFHYKYTGKLSPGCDARDFYFVPDQILGSKENG